MDCTDQVLARDASCIFADLNRDEKHAIFLQTKDVRILLVIYDVDQVVTNAEKHNQPMSGTMGISGVVSPRQKNPNSLFGKLLENHLALLFL